jgi:hypothetical protein
MGVKAAVVVGVALSLAACGSRPLGERDGSVGHRDGGAGHGGGGVGGGPVRPYPLGKAGERMAPGTVCETDGWCWYNPLPAGAWWREAQGQPSNFWVVGASAVALRFAGGAWSTVPMPLGLTETVWVDGPNDVWLGGTGLPGQGAIARWNGSTATIVFQGGGAISDIVMVGMNDGYAAGLSELLHWDGSAWSPVPGVAGSKLAVARNELWLGASDGLWHRVGGVWSRVPELEGAFVSGVAATGASDVWVLAGQTVRHFDGQSWSVSFTNTDQRVILQDLAAGGPDDVWLVGDHFVDFEQHGYLNHFDGTAWTPGADPSSPLSRVNVIPIRGAIATGQGGGVFQLSAGTPPTSVDLRSGSVEQLDGVWGTSPTDMWAVGRRGTALHYDGTAVRSSPTGITTDLNDVWGSGPADVWAVGAQGVAIRFDGTSWTAVPTGAGADLFAVTAFAPNDVWVGGRAGTLLHYDGVAFAPVALPGADAVTEILDLHGISGGDVWLSGFAMNRGGLVAHYDGTAWSAANVLNQNAGGYPARRIWDLAPDDVWMLTQPVFRGMVSYWHFDGATWIERFMLPSPETWMFPKPGEGDGFAFGAGDVWFVGQYGAWQRRITP